MADHADKTEKPTQRKREETRDKGNVARSQELNSVAVLLGGLLAFYVVGGFFGSTFKRFVVTTYQESSLMEITAQSLPGQIADFMTLVAKLLLPVFLTLLLFSLATNVAQVGVVFAKKALIPDIKRINPLNGVKRMFSLRSLVEMLKGLLKVTILVIISYSVIQKYQESYILLPHRSPAEILGFILKVISELTIKSGIALLIMAVADFAYQKWQHEKELRMSKQEVKDENKQYEGDPQLKSHMRSIQREQAMNRMMQAVPDATVVVTNPTHIAVALKYEPQSRADAPKVVAKGKLKIAEKIKSIARENEVPVIEDKALARGLYNACELNTEIPMAFYQAVAEILSKIYLSRNNQTPPMENN